MVLITEWSNGWREEDPKYTYVSIGTPVEASNGVDLQVNRYHPWLARTYGKDVWRIGCFKHTETPKNHLPRNWIGVL